LLANGQSAALSLLRLLGLPLSLGHAFTFEAAMKLLVALSFAYLFMRRRGHSELAALVTAISFALSTAITVWLHFPLASVTAFLPLVFYAVDLLFERISYPRFLLLVAAFWQMLLHGHPESAAHIVLAAGAYVLFLLMTGWSRERMRSAGVMAIAGMVALILALPFVLPFLEALPFTHRYNMLEEFPDAYDRPTDARFLMTLLQPRFYGSVGEGTAWGPAHAEVIAGYCGVLALAGWIAMLIELVRSRRWRFGARDRGRPAAVIPSQETALCVTEGRNDTSSRARAGGGEGRGTSPIPNDVSRTAESGKARKQAEGWNAAVFFVFASPVLLGVILNWPVISALFRATPLLDIAANQRLRFVLCWFLAILLGMAIDLTRERSRAPFAIGLAITAAILVAAFPANDVVARGILARTLTTTLPAAAVLVAAMWATATRMRRVLSTMLLLTLIATDLVVFSQNWNPVVSEEKLYPATPMIERLQELEREAGESAPFRIAGTAATLFPNGASMYGLEDIRGHDPMANSKVLGLLRVLTGYTSASYFAQLNHVDHPLIDYLNVRYVLTTTAEALDVGHFTMVYQNIDGRIWENNRVRPRWFPAERVLMEFEDHRRIPLLVAHRDWAGTAVVKRLHSSLIDLVQDDVFGPREAGALRTRVEIVEASPRRWVLDVDAPRWTLVVSSQPTFPGWRIYDQQGEELKLITVNEGFIGFLAPPGRSRITIRYRPRSFYVGLGVALAMVGVLIGVPFRRSLQLRH
ncbi:MAG TPA: hypothetical protein VM534_05830, partial [Thermoanaerobaculia bacterium]|nr:hypothetical protein [Thermoanaerobaculia bacterium]